MIRIAIVDDAAEIGTQLEAILIEITTNKGIAIDTDIYYSGKELCAHLLNGEFYDLIFLDIEMPEFTGIDVSKQGGYIRNRTVTGRLGQCQRPVHYALRNSGFIVLTRGQNHRRRHQQ